jgi:hypothetical protein
MQLNVFEATEVSYMGLQDQIAEAIVMTFDELGGDPNAAVKAALRQPTVMDWVQQETAKIAVAGGAELIIPGVQLLTIPAGISYLMHKMAYISWGIGALQGAYIVETPRHSDLRNILTLWANGNYFNAHLLDHLPISAEAFASTQNEAGYNTLQTALGNADEADEVLHKTLSMLDEIGASWVGDERSVQMVSDLLGQKRARQLMNEMQERVAPHQSGSLPPVNTRISSKLAAKLAARISARVPARMVMGFIPFAGAILNAVFNANTLRSMADVAQKYYDHALTMETIDGLAEDL